jgi:hypothetical protein
MPTKKVTLTLDYPEQKRIGNINESVTLWRKPKTLEVYAYRKGTDSGQGLIGHAYNGEVSYHISTEGKYDATITWMDEDSITVEVELHNYVGRGYSNWIKIEKKKGTSLVSNEMFGCFAVIGVALLVLIIVMAIGC